MLKSSILFVLIVGTYSSSFSNRITGGQNATLWEIMNMASVRHRGFHICGGAIIDKTHVITAASCVWQRTENPLEYSVLIGYFDLIELDQQQVVQVIPHPDYQPDSHQNDIAVLTLLFEIQFSAITQPVPFPEQDQDNPGYEVGIFGGWGADEPGGDLNRYLQSINLTSTPDTLCENLYPEYAEPLHHICAGSEESNQGLCDGDVGGPLNIDGVLIGIASYTDKPCTGFPTLFTKVAHHVDWLRDHMWCP